ncbi:MAG: DMP19 family protein [Burkholderiales bacterium]|nr:DMP19 family protein [Burkholderiales bacterium]
MARSAIKTWLLQRREMRNTCPACGAPYVDPTPTPPFDALNNEFVKFGVTVAQVLKHRGKVPDRELDANIGFILLNKEQQRSLESFSQAERHVATVQAMFREVNNGGFEQFFDNSSGELAYDLVPALEAMNSVENLRLAKQALERFGKPRSLSMRDRIDHITKITRNGEERLWDDLDSAFYDDPEDIEKMILDYIERNLGQFAA